MYFVGSLHYNGQGITQDYVEALKWYHKAADAGEVRAMYVIGFQHDSGKGVTQDYVEALKWYQKAADKGYAPAIKRIKEIDTLFPKK